MKTSEIEYLIELKKFIITIDDYIKIINTSPQIRDLSYNRNEDKFCIETDDHYKVKFNIKSRKD